MLEKLYHNIFFGKFSITWLDWRKQKFCFSGIFSPSSFQPSYSSKNDMIQQDWLGERKCRNMSHSLMLLNSKRQGWKLEWSHAIRKCSPKIVCSAHLKNLPFNLKLPSCSPVPPPRCSNPPVLINGSIMFLHPNLRDLVRCCEGAFGQRSPDKRELRLLLLC